MRLSEPPTFLSLLPILLHVTLTSASTYACNDIRTNGVKFDLSPLKGPHNISHAIKEHPSVHNTTFTLDICGTLKRPKGLKKDEFCRTNTWVCGTEYVEHNGGSILESVIEIAGDYSMDAGGRLDAKWELFSSSSSHKDVEREGVRVTMNGGSKDVEDAEGKKTKRKQQAIIEFICDKGRTGLEDWEESTVLFDAWSRGRKNKRDEDDPEDDPEDDDEEGGDNEKDNPDANKDRSLTFIGYGPPSGGKEMNMDQLRLEWRTKYACEEASNGDAESGSSGHWGFFTWIIIVVFMGTAAYLIFGSWLNYNRYGARGWDLLPHGDTIRDVPYILRDLGRRVAQTLQGPGARGGYSAV